MSATTAVRPPPLLGSLRRRACPVCGNEDDRSVVFETHVDEARIDAMSYSSRKLPEFMNLRMVRCPCCELLYAPDVPNDEFLATAYRDTGYESAEEAEFAAESYAAGLARVIGHVPDRDAALEIGSGNGAFLSHLKAAGFRRVVGIEPSVQAVASAPVDVRGWIRLEPFDAARHQPGEYSLVVAFQTLEHIEQPFAFLQSAALLLKPGGVAMVVSHNWRHWLMRLLGRRSPIVDIEHLQLFSPMSLRHAFAAAGFAGSHVVPFRNRYPLHYWARLLPIPDAPKHRLLHSLRRGVARPLGALEIEMTVGNMMGWAWKP